MILKRFFLLTLLYPHINSMDHRCSLTGQPFMGRIISCWQLLSSEAIQKKKYQELLENPLDLIDLLDTASSARLYFYARELKRDDESLHTQLKDTFEKKLLKLNAQIATREKGKTFAHGTSPQSVSALRIAQDFLFDWLADLHKFLMCHEDEETIDIPPLFFYSWELLPSLHITPEFFTDITAWIKTDYEAMREHIATLCQQHQHKKSSRCIIL